MFIVLFWLIQATPYLILQLFWLQELAIEYIGERYDTKCNGEKDDISEKIIFST